MTVVGQVVPANQVPLVVLPTGTLGESIRNPKIRMDLGGPEPLRPRGMV